MKRFAAMAAWGALCGFLGCVGIDADAQLPPPEQKPLVGAHMPALSPNGKRLAFVWRGDVWVADATGGHAVPVTSHEELDAYPVFSPDGNWIAYSSLRNGNWDIYVVPAVGGDSRQMTFSSTSEIVTDWSPDGKTLLFTSSYDHPNSTLYALDVVSLRIKKLTEDMDTIGRAACSPDGRSIVWQRYGFPWTRPRYTGSAAAQLWTLDPTTGKRTALTNDDKQNLWPHYLPDNKTVVAVTVGEATPNAQWLNKPLPRLQDSALRTPNLWAFSAPGAKPKQLTHFVGGGVRFPVVALQSGDIAFEYEKDLFLLRKGKPTPERIVLYAGAGDKLNNVQNETLTTGATEAEISPDGKTFAFGARGDLWTIPLEKPKGRGADDAFRLTDYAGSDRDFVWSPDNKLLYFISDRDNNDRLYSLDVATKTVKPIWTGNQDASRPTISPDKKWLGFWVSGPVGANSPGGFYIKPLAEDQANVAPKRILALPTAAQGQISWSPDMKWIAYIRPGIESSGRNIWIAPADGTGTPVNVTKLNANHSLPFWSPDGKFLFFSSDRQGAGLYVLPLKQESAPAEELEVKWEKPKGPVTVDIDFTDTQYRIRKISTQQPQADLTVTADGKLFFVSEGDAWTASYDGKEVRRLGTGGGVSHLRVSPDGNKLTLLKSGGLYTYTMNNNALAQTTFVARWDRDVRAERKAAFIEFWRGYNRRFYDPNFHGRDWAAIRDRYEPQLDGVGTRDEFATLLNMMIGELEASHSEVGAAPKPFAGPTTYNLGVYFDYSYEGPGIRVRDVPKRAPGSYEATRIRPGEYIVAVDGKDVTLDENLFTLLNDKGDRDFVLLVNSKPGRDGARTVKYKALTSAEWSDIHYRNRIELAQKTVERESKGQLAYVHIAGMGGTNQDLFEKELYAYAEGKAGVIIDVRNNGGGNISDTLINWLGTKPYGTYFPRDGYPGPAPGRGWKKPIVVLMNDHSYSNAEMFPYGMRAAGLAKLVGTPTPGYVIWTSGWTLVDGTSARMPGSGVFRADGSPMEDMGEQPDVLVPLTNEDWLAQRDPQLERAISMLMSK